MPRRVPVLPLPFHVPLRRSAALLALAFLPVQPVAAHPHVFIEAGLDFVLDGSGLLVAVDVSWIYDELYSLILIEDQSLDQDGDGELTPEEIELLAVQDRNWSVEYEGDLYGTAGAERIALAGPELFGLDYVDGRIHSTHRRPLAVPVDPRAAPVVFKNYDPWFYAAFDVTLPVRVVATVSGAVTGAGCTAEHVPADYEAASAKVAALIRAAPADTVEMDFPMVGEDFAGSIVLTCAER